MGLSWELELKEEFKKPYFLNLQHFLASEQAEVYPPAHLIFNAFLHTPFDQVNVVILGQDPYHGKGQAEGLSFSVPEGIPLPPSLRHIFQEMSSDLGCAFPSHGSLVHWAKQGVLLLNVLLTVRAGSPLSHQGKGWEEFTDAVILKLIQRKDPIIFVLWGNIAKKKVEKLIDSSTHHRLLIAAHPSPLSAYRGFFGCHHFSRINQVLKEFGKSEIVWNVI